METIANAQADLKRTWRKRTGRVSVPETEGYKYVHGRP